MEDRYLFKAKRVENGGLVVGYIARYGYTKKEKYYIIPSYASDLYSFLIQGILYSSIAVFNCVIMDFAVS